MSETVTITHHDTAPGAGEYHAHVAGIDAIGRLTWKQRGTTRTADHTEVPEVLGGRGVAGKLVEALVADARAQGFTVVPECSYVAASFKRHPEWSDLLA